MMNYQRDDGKRRLSRTIGGTLTGDDALMRLENQAADGTWAYATLLDMRMVSSWLTFDEMARVMLRSKAISRELGKRGPVAIVVANPALIPVGQAQAIVETEVGRAGFFRDFEGAERWLDLHQSR